VSGDATVDGKVNDVVMEDLSSSVTTISSSVTTLESKVNGITIVDGPVPTETVPISQLTWTDSPQEPINGALYSSYQIVGNRVTVFGQISITFLTGITYASPLIPYPIVDGKTYAIDTDLQNSVQFTGHFLYNNQLMVTEYVLPHDDTTFELGFTKPDYSAWDGALNGNGMTASFSVTYIYTVVEPT
jgi:hypothetical protein